MTDIQRVTEAELRSIVERLEQLAAEKKDISAQEKELFAEAKGRGYDAKPLREVLRLRKMDPEARAEFEAIVDLYRNAIGMV